MEEGRPPAARKMEERALYTGFLFCLPSDQRERSPLFHLSSHGPTPTVMRDSESVMTIGVSRRKAMQIDLLAAFSADRSKAMAYTYLSANPAASNDPVPTGEWAREMFYLQTKDIEQLKISP
jgi:hypothetical protein